MFTILAIALLFVVLRILARIMAERKCIEDNDIRRYMTNRLPERARNRMIAHLGICEKCQQKLQDYNFGNEIEDHLIDES